jgi:hypothetical protein
MDKEFLSKLIRSREIASGLLHDDELAHEFDLKIANAKAHLVEPIHDFSYGESNELKQID